MAVSFDAGGSGNTGSSSCTPGYPAGLSTDHYVVACIASGDATEATPTESSDFVLLGTAANGGSWGNSTGPRPAAAFGLESDGTESGSETFSNPGGANAVIGGIMYSFDRSTANDWEVDAHGQGYDAGDAANLDVTFPGVDLASGDALCILLSGPEDASGFSSPALSATGITFSGVTERVDVGQPTGNDIRIAVYTATVTSGSGVVGVDFSVAEDESAGVVMVVIRDRALAGGTDYTRTPADPVGVTDAATAAIARERAVADPVGVTDATAVAISRSAAPSDAVGLSDAVGAVVARARAVTDAVGLSDAVSVAIARSVTVADAVGITDATDVQAAGDRTASVDDGVGVTDGTTVAVARERSTADAVGITDSVEVQLGRAVTAADAVGVTDSVGVAIARRVSVADAVGIDDEATSTGGELVVRNDVGHRAVEVFDRHKAVEVRDRHQVKEIR